MQMERLMRHCELLADADLLGNPAHLQHALELAIQFPNAGKHISPLTVRQQCRDAASQMRPLSANNLRLKPVFCTGLVSSCRQSNLRSVAAMLC